MHAALFTNDNGWLDVRWYPNAQDAAAVAAEREYHEPAEVSDIEARDET